MKRPKLCSRKKASLWAAPAWWPWKWPIRPGGLDAVLQLVSRNGINVEYMYAFVQRDQESAVMIFRFDKVDHAVDVLRDNGFTIIPADQLCEY